MHYPRGINRPSRSRESQGGEAGRRRGGRKSREGFEHLSEPSERERERKERGGGGRKATMVDGEGEGLAAGSLRRVTRGFVDDYTPRVCG